MVNSYQRAEMIFKRRALLEAMGTISSTYNNRDTVSEPRRKMKREMLDFATMNPNICR
jgi:hypothetical protein